MNKYSISKHRGVGLIEVLIALVVVSLGLLGLAKFEANLLKTSGNNKARAEAIGIAQQQIEIIRYEASTKDSFEAIDNVGSPIDLNPFVLMGTNAQFTVDIDIDDPDANLIINAIVDVVWTDATGTADNVTLMSEIALQDVQKSALNTNDSAASTAVPSPRQSASEDVRPASDNVNENDVVSPTETPLPYQGTVAEDGSVNGLASSFNVVGTDSVTYNLQEIAPDSRYYSTKFDEGVIGVYVCDGSPSGGNVGCRYVQNHFGGISLSTSGVIYSAKNTNNDLSNTSAVWSSSEVTSCYVGSVAQVGSGQNSVFSKPYECIYAGNCVDSSGSCQRGVTVAEVVLNGVGPGGEFGNLGLIGLDGGNNGDQVCFLEDTPNILTDADGEALLNGTNQDGGGNPPQYNEAYLLPVTTRTYVTRRLLSNGEERSEGINKSFRNHNFLLVNRANNADEDNCHLAVNENAGSLATYVLAPRNIIRVRTDIVAPVTNPVESVATFDGVMPAITVSSSSSGNRPSLYIPDVGSCYVKGDNSTFACVVPNNALNDVNGITIYGKSASVPTPTGADPAVPVAYQTCTFDVDETEIGNIESDTTSLGVALPAGFDCRWPTDF